MPKTGGFDEKWRKWRFTIYPQKQGVALLGARKPTKMTKMTGVPQTKPGFAKNRVFATLIMERRGLREEWPLCGLQGRDGGKKQAKTPARAQAAQNLGAEKKVKASASLFWLPSHADEDDAPSSPLTRRSRTYSPLLLNLPTGLLVFQQLIRWHRNESEARQYYFRINYPQNYDSESERKFGGGGSVKFTLNWLSCQKIIGMNKFEKAKAKVKYMSEELISL